MKKVALLGFTILWGYMLLEWTLPHQLQVIDDRHHPYAGLLICVAGIVLGALVAKLASGASSNAEGSKPNDRVGPAR